jgi:hypothetical protein
MYRRVEMDEDALTNATANQTSKNEVGCGILAHQQKYS